MSNYSNSRECRVDKMTGGLALAQLSNTLSRVIIEIKVWLTMDVGELIDVRGPGLAGHS